MTVSRTDTPIAIAPLVSLKNHEVRNIEIKEEH